MERPRKKTSLDALREFNDELQRLRNIDNLPTLQMALQGLLAKTDDKLVLLLARIIRRPFQDAQKARRYLVACIGMGTITIDQLQTALQRSIQRIEEKQRTQQQTAPRPQPTTEPPPDTTVADELAEIKRALREQSAPKPQQRSLLDRLLGRKKKH